ncbi:hypothetical protein MMC10_011428 [Thelotrema lepadinum]|nr:hypothetical protein [Thelotrema lepadinum]
MDRPNARRPIPGSEPSSAQPLVGSIDLKVERAPKRRRLLSLVDNWRSDIPPYHCPRHGAYGPLAKFDSREISSAVPVANSGFDTRSKSPLQNDRFPEDESFKQRSIVKTSSPLYRSLFANNAIHVNRVGTPTPLAIKAFMKTVLRKPRVPLPQESLLEAANKADQLADSTQVNTTSLLDTIMLCAKRPGLSIGRSSQRYSVDLMTDAEYPSPDSLSEHEYSVGYSLGRDSG